MNQCSNRGRLRYGCWCYDWGRLNKSRHWCGLLRRNAEQIGGSCTGYGLLGVTLLGQLCHNLVHLRDLLFLRIQLNDPEGKHDAQDKSSAAETCDKGDP